MTHKKPFRIHQGKTFSAPIRITIAILVCAFIFIIMRNLGENVAIISSIFISMILPATWFATKIFEISTSTLFTGNWTLGFRFGTYHKFESLNLLIRKEKIKPTEFILGDNSTVLCDEEFRAYLKTENNSEFYLFGHPLEKKVIEKISLIQEKISSPEIKVSIPDV